MRYNWEQLNKLQVGAFSEYFVKMEFTMYGFQVYTTEVDDRGIDFVIRYENRSFRTIQVKSIREKGYIFMQKQKFEISKNSYLAMVILNEGKAPNLYLIPSTVWKKPNGIFVDRDYEGKASPPEYGINVSKKNFAYLSQFNFEASIRKLMNT